MKRENFLLELGVRGGGGQFYFGNRMKKIEHEGIGTCARIEISQRSKSKIISENS